MLCRLDSVLKDTHDAVVAENKRIHYKNKAPFLTAISKHKFYNVSEFTFESLTSDSGLIRDNLIDYIKGFSENACTILESYFCPFSLRGFKKHSSIGFLLPRSVQKAYFLFVDFRPAFPCRSEECL